mgnify:CR=1 FL=1|tara:strand:+ start:293 stop:505 length:213 start_codon:yes stop_codon:yes gene_type:complete
MKIYAYLAMVLTAIGAALGLQRYVVANDRRKRELQDSKDKLTASEKKNEIANLDDDAVSERLNKWVRDDD